MHILVLGGNGFIGSHFVHQAGKAGHDISVLSRKTSAVWAHHIGVRHLHGDFNTLAEHPEWLDGVDAVCHAAWSSVPKTAASDPQGDVQTNVVGTLKLLDMIQAATTVEHLMFISSGGAVYGSVFSNDPILESQRLSPISAYGIGKMAAESYCTLLMKECDKKLTIIRPSNPYGAGQSSQGILGVVSTFLACALGGRTADIFGDGSVVRDFLDVRDLAALMVKAFELPVPGIYNCGSGVGVSLREVVEAVEAVTRTTLKLNHLPERSFDPPRVVLDIGRAQECLGWKPQIDLKSGVEDLHAFMENKG